MENKNIKQKIISEIIEWFFCFIIAFIIYLFLNYFIGTISGVRQVSMKPTAVEGEKLLISRTVFNKKTLKYGDIITFVAPDYNPSKLENNGETITGNDAVAPYKERGFIENFFYDFVGIGKKSYIKRVIGVAGDHIYISNDGKVYVNDVILDEPYLKDGTTNINGAYIDVIVPDDCIFAMGDNRLQSMDCRYFGCIPINKVDGYVITRVWPFTRLGNI